MFVDEDRATELSQILALPLNIPVPLPHEPTSTERERCGCATSEEEQGETTTRRLCKLRSEGKKLQYVDLWFLLRSTIVPYLRPCAPVDRPDSTVVMHMRSGDVWNIWPRRHAGAWDMKGHTQPPCSYYVNIMENGLNGGPFDHGIIISLPERTNPCIDHLLLRYPDKVRLQAGSMSEDSCYMMTARYVALSASSFASTLLFLNQNVATAYVAGTRDFDAMGMPPIPAGHVGDPMPWTQHMYEFPDFQPQLGDWRTQVMEDPSYWVNYDGPISYRIVEGTSAGPLKNDSVSRK